jgi:hypothetical protein
MIVVGQPGARCKIEKTTMVTPNTIGTMAINLLVITLCIFPPFLGIGGSTN